MVEDDEINESGEILRTKQVLSKIRPFLSHNRSEATKTELVLMNPRFPTNSGSLTPSPTLGNSDSKTKHLVGWSRKRRYTRTLI